MRPYAIHRRCSAPEPAPAIEVGRNAGNEEDTLLIGFAFGPVCVILISYTTTVRVKLKASYCDIFE